MRKKTNVDQRALLRLRSQKQYYYCRNQLLSFRKHSKPSRHRFKLNLFKFTLLTYEQNLVHVKKNASFYELNYFGLINCVPSTKKNKNLFYFQNTSVKFIPSRSLD